MTTSVFVSTKRYFDRSGGNSYFASRIFVDGREVARQPFQYGYDSQDLHEARLSLISAEVLPADCSTYLPTALREAGIVFYQNPIDTYTTKRAVSQWGDPSDFTA